jgi:hypothetical protein
VLGVLPPVDLAALDIAVQQFLARLEQAVPQLARHPDGQGLISWVVAAAAAAVACEIGRRQLRHRTAPAPLETPGGPGDGPQRPGAE